jgi:hypothetical protein
MSTAYQFIPDEAKRWTDRYGRPIAVVEVTIRTVGGMYLLTPNARNASLIRGVLGRAQERLDFELYGYAFLSNHGSMLVGVRDAKHLADIMEYIHSNIARELGRKEHSNWPGRFWGRRGTPILVLTNEDLVIRLKYLLANGTKEHLVKRPERWRGAHCAKAMCHGIVETGTWIDRTRLGIFRAASKSTGKRVSEADATTYYEVVLSQLPCWAELDEHLYRQRMRAICKDISQAAAKEREESGQSVMGQKRLERMSPHHIPSKLAESPAPKVHCNKPQTSPTRF